MSKKEEPFRGLWLYGLVDCNYNKTFNFLQKQSEIKYSKLSTYKQCVRILKFCFIFLRVLFRFNIEIIKEGRGKHLFLILPADLRKDIVDCVTKLKSNVPEGYIVKFHNCDCFVGIKNVCVDLKHCRLWLRELFKYDLSILSIFTILINCIKIIRYQRLLMKVDMTNVKSVTFFYDAETTNNYFAQMYKSKGLETITLQHGIMVAPVKELSDNVDFAGIEFEGVVCNHFLVWNEFTKQQAMSCGIKESVIHVVGPLKCIGMKRIKEAPSNSLFCLILDGRFTDENNRPMILLANRIAKDLNMKYIVRFHPSYSKNEFDDIIDFSYAEKCVESYSLVDLAEQCSFFIIANSTALIELSYCGALIYRYSSRDMKDKYRLLKYPSFHTIEELYVIQQRDKTILKNNLRLHLCGNSDYLINNYIRFYNTIC